MKRIFFIFLTIAVSSCSRQPKAIAYDVDACDFCRMTISDTRFGGEIITDKGRVYKFDDLHCLKGFVEDETVPRGEIHSFWLVDFDGSGRFIPAEESFLLHNDGLQSPMGSNLAAFGSEQILKSYQEKNNGDVITWNEFLNTK